MNIRINSAILGASGYLDRMKEAKKQAKAQSQWDEQRRLDEIAGQRCARCGHPRSFHNGGNRWEDRTICKRFLSGAAEEGER